MYVIKVLTRPNAIKRQEKTKLGSQCKDCCFGGEGEREDPWHMEEGEGGETAPWVQYLGACCYTFVQAQCECPECHPFYFVSIDLVA